MRYGDSGSGGLTGEHRPVEIDPQVDKDGAQDEDGEKSSARDRGGVDSAASGANAADMVVKAKPVLYVKICSLYGDGFYYIPGTDTCIKIGGYYRLQTEWNAGSSGQAIGSGTAEAVQARFTRDVTNDISYTSRAVMSLDVRNQTEYGTLRSYIRAGWSASTPSTGNGGTGGPGNVINYWDRAFIQFAGFTVGRAQSFFDIFTYGGQFSYLNVRTAGDTGASGATVWAYTAQFGNGFTITGSLEDPVFHKFGTCDASAACWAVNGGTTNDNAFAQQATNLQGFRVPDMVLNARIDQAWGYVGASVVVHDVSGAYYQHGQQRQQRASGRQVRLGGCGWRTGEHTRRR